MAIERLTPYIGDAWFWVVVGADFLLVVSSFFSIFYLARIALSATLPRRFDAERRLPGVFPLFALSLALSLTHASRFVAGLWKGVMAALLGDNAETWFPHAPVLIWLVGTGILSIILMGRYVSLARALRRLPVYEDPAFAEAIAAVEPGRTVAVKNCGCRTSACSWGIARPCVLVPADFRERFDESERRCIYIHELMHLDRRDPGKYFLVAILGTLFWFHPVVRHALRALMNRIEIVCDRRTVLASGMHPATYAGLILKAHASGQDLVPGFSFEKGEVRNRIGHIVNEPSLIFPPIRTARRAALCLAFLLGASMLFHEYIAAEWRLPDPDPRHLAREGDPVVSGIGFYWSGALGTYMKVSFPKR